MSKKQAPVQNLEIQPDDMLSVNGVLLFSVLQYLDSRPSGETKHLSAALENQMKEAKLKLMQEKEVKAAAVVGSKRKVR